MSDRWKVRRVRYPFDNFLGVYDDFWEVRDQHGHRSREFRTHAEALAYADRMARTIEVTLPRGPLAWLSGLDSDGREYVTEVDGNEICYEPGGLGEIALRLLAYHYRKGKP